jgi:hypothetical protein
MIRGLDLNRHSLGDRFRRFAQRGGPTRRLNSQILGPIAAPQWIFRRLET